MKAIKLFLIILLVPLGAFALIMFAGAMVVIYNFDSESRAVAKGEPETVPSSLPAPVAEVPPKPDPKAHGYVAKHLERADAIEKEQSGKDLELFEEMGLLDRVVDGRVPHVWVTPKFLDATPQGQNSMCRAVWTVYCADATEQRERLSLRLTTTGEEVGDYTPETKFRLH